MKKKTVTILLSITLMMLFSSASYAATLGAKVTATIPTFKVTMNGQAVDNTYREYPFLVYNDITYFPMTYWDMRFLGVSNTWTAETGNVVVTDGTTSTYNPTLTNVSNKTKNTVTINAGKFTINGKVIDNSKEEYPILSFRDVPYFPLTWSWCQEFGWNISFDSANGLVVNTSGKMPASQGQNIIDDKKVLAQKIIQLVVQEQGNISASDVQIIELQKNKNIIIASVGNGDKKYFYKNGSLYDFDKETEYLASLPIEKRDMKYIDSLIAYLTESNEILIEQKNLLKDSKNFLNYGGSWTNLTGKWDITQVVFSDARLDAYLPYSDSSNIVFNSDGTFTCFVKSALTEKTITGRWEKTSNSKTPYLLYPNGKFDGIAGMVDTTTLIVVLGDVTVSCVR